MTALQLLVISLVASLALLPNAAGSFNMSSNTTDFEPSNNKTTTTESLGREQTITESGPAVTLGPTELSNESRTTHLDKWYAYTNNESTTDTDFNGNETEGSGSLPSISTTAPMTTAEQQLIQTTSDSATTTESDLPDDAGPGIIFCIGTEGFTANGHGIVIIAVVGFITLILMPSIICCLIVALGCTCIKYRRQKMFMNHKSDINADERNVKDVTNASNDVMMLEELEMEQNVAYSRKESCDYAYVIQNPYENELLTIAETQ